MNKDLITITSLAGQKCTRISIDLKVYSLDTVYAAGYVFLDRAYLILDKGNKKINIFLIPKNKKENLKKLGMDFSNELLNYAHYYSRAKATKGIVEKILQRALFSAAPGLIEESEEREIEELLKDLEKDEQTKELVKELKNEKKSKSKK